MDEAMFRFEKMRADVEVSEFVYLSMAKAWAYQGSLKEAEEVFECMVQDGVTPNQMIYHTLINAYGRRGQLESAMRWFEKMKAADFTPDPMTHQFMLRALVAA